MAKDKNWNEAEAQEGVTQEAAVSPEKSITPEVTVSPEGNAYPSGHRYPSGHKGTTVYVGPNLPRLAMRRFQVFRGGIPPYATRAIEKIPEAGKLIVPVEKLEEARRKIDTPGTNEARLFDAVNRAAREMK